jgi:hypothetical protein
MRLSNIYCKLFLEYGGLDFGRISLDVALEEADKDPKAVIAIQCPLSGHWGKKFNRSGMHSQLIQSAVNDGVRDAWYAVRAYWVPVTGKLMLYQMETPAGHMVDPSENIIERLAHNLDIRDKIMSIDIIG